MKFLLKVEKVPVPRPCTPEIICLDDPVIIKPSRFSVQPAKSSSGVCKSLQRSTASVHCTTAQDIDEETVDADVKRIAAAITKRYGDNVGCNVIGGSDCEQLEKSNVVTDDRENGGVNPEMGGVNPEMERSDTKVAVQSDECPIVVSSDSEDNASKKKKEDKTRKVTGDTKQSEKPRFCMIKGNWIQSKLDSVDHMEALYSLGANFILGIELLGYPTVNIDARDENIGKEVRLPTIDDIAEKTRQHLWCTEVGIINSAPEVVEFHEPRYSRGVSWPQSYRAIMYAIDPGPVMYANELVICEEDVPKFYVCTTTGGERMFAAVESKALPRKSLERVTLMTTTCKLNSQQTLTNFININGGQYPKDARICFVPDPMIVIKSTEV